MLEESGIWGRTGLEALPLLAFILSNMDLMSMVQKEEGQGAGRECSETAGKKVGS